MRSAWPLLLLLIAACSPAPAAAPAPAPTTSPAAAQTASPSPSPISTPSPSPTAAPSPAAFTLALTGQAWAQVGGSLEVAVAGLEGAPIAWTVDASSTGRAKVEPGPASTYRVVPTAPGSLLITATSAGRSARLFLAAVASDVGPAFTTPGIDANSRLSWTELFPPGVFLLRSAADWQQAWERSARYTQAFLGSTVFTSPPPSPPLPPIDFQKRSLVMIAASLYGHEFAPRLVSVQAGSPARLEVVKPERFGDGNYLDFNQYLVLYEVPALPADVQVQVDCSPLGRDCLPASPDFGAAAGASSR